MGNPCWDLQIGANVAGLVPLFGRGIPRPETWSFSRTSRIETDGMGVPRGFGFGTAEWFFGTMSQKEVNIFLDFLGGDTVMGISLVIWTYTDDGTGGDQILERFQAVMHRPVDGDDKQMITDTSKPTYDGVKIRFTHLATV